MIRLGPVPLRGDSEEKEDYTGSQQFKPQIGRSSAGILHREDKPPCLVGGLLGPTRGLWEAWIPLVKSMRAD